jgi:putative aldouronate transport system permease protein
VPALEVPRTNPSMPVIKKKPGIFTTIMKYKYLYLMLLPGIALYILFSYVPMYGIILAFKKFMYNKGIMGSPWVGLDNFQYILQYKDFWIAFRNTIIIAGGKLIFGFPAPIIISLLLNELRNQKFKKIIQSVLYLPHFLSWIIIFGIVFNLLSVTSGVLAKVLMQYFGMRQVAIIGNPDYFLPLIFISDIWKGVGWGTIIYLAAISGINPELYESAIIDGANRFKQCLYITLPSLKYAIIILLILDMGGIMDAGFDQIFNFYDPGTYNVGDIIDTFVYRLGITGGRYEISTAVGLFKSVINCALLLAANKIANSFGEEGLF